MQAEQLHQVHWTVLLVQGIMGDQEDFVLVAYTSNVATFLSIDKFSGDSCGYSFFFLPGLSKRVVRCVKISPTFSTSHYGKKTERKMGINR